MTNPNEPGLSLLDVAPATELVKVGGQNVTVYGISVEGIVALLPRFPQMREWFKAGNVDVQRLVVEAPGAIAAVIAAGCGCAGNADAETKASRMAVETQIDFIEAIGRLTFKSGFGPFVERIVALADAARSVNFGRASGTKSPQEPKPSSQADTDPQMSGE